MEWQELFSWAILAMGAGMYPLGFFLVGNCSTCCCSFTEFLRCIRFERISPVPTENEDDGRLGWPEGLSMATTFLEDSGVVYVFTEVRLDSESDLTLQEEAKALSAGESREVKYTINFLGDPRVDMTLTILGQDIPFIGPLEIGRASFTGGDVRVEDGVIDPTFNPSGLCLIRLSTENAGREINYNATREFELLDAWCSEGQEWADGSVYDRQYLMSLITLQAGPSNQQEAIWIRLPRPPQEFARYLQAENQHSALNPERTVVTYLLRWKRGTQVRHFTASIAMWGEGYRVLGPPSVPQDTSVGSASQDLQGVFPDSAGTLLADGYAFEVFDAVPGSGREYLDGAVVSRASLRARMVPTASQIYPYFTLSWQGSGSLFDYVPQGSAVEVEYTFRIRQPWETTWVYFTVRVYVSGGGQPLPADAQPVTFAALFRESQAPRPFTEPLVTEQVVFGQDTPYQIIEPAYGPNYTFSVGAPWENAVRLPDWGMRITLPKDLDRMVAVGSEANYTLSYDRDPSTLPVPGKSIGYPLSILQALSPTLSNKRPIIRVCTWNIGYSGGVLPQCNRPIYNHANIDGWLFRNQDLTVYVVSTYDATTDPEILSASEDEQWTSRVSPPTTFCGVPLCDSQIGAAPVHGGVGDDLNAVEEDTSWVYGGGPTGLGYIDFWLAEPGGIPRTVRYDAKPLEQEVTLSNEKGSGDFINYCAGQEKPVSLTMHQYGCGWRANLVTCDDILTGCFVPGGGLIDDPAICNSSSIYVPSWGVKSYDPSVSVFDFYNGDMLWAYENGPYRESFQRNGDTYTLGAKREWDEGEDEESPSDHCNTGAGNIVDVHGFALANSVSGCWVGEGTLTVPASVLEDARPDNEWWLGCYTNGSHLVAGDYVASPSFNCGVAYYYYTVPVVNNDVHASYYPYERLASFTVYERIAKWCDPTIVWRQVAGTSWLRTGGCDPVGDLPVYINAQVFIGTADPDTAEYYPVQPGWGFSTASGVVQPGLGRPTTLTPEVIAPSTTQVAEIDARWRHPALAWRGTDIAFNTTSLDVAWHIYPQLLITDDNYGDIFTLINLSEPHYLPREGSGYCEIFNPDFWLFGAKLIDPRLNDATDVSEFEGTWPIPVGSCRILQFYYDPYVDARAPCQIQFSILNNPQMISITRLNAQGFKIVTKKAAGDPDTVVTVRFSVSGSPHNYQLRILVTDDPGYYG